MVEVLETLMLPSNLHLVTDVSQSELRAAFKRPGAALPDCSLISYVDPANQVKNDLTLTPGVRLQVAKYD